MARHHCLKFNRQLLIITKLWERTYAIYIAKWMFGIVIRGGSLPEYVALNDSIWNFTTPRKRAAVSEDVRVTKLCGDVRSYRFLLYTVGSLHQTMC